MQSQAHIYIHGVVIGVGFRAWIKMQAKDLHLSGWVKNVYDRPDRFGRQGGIEGVLQGEKVAIESLLNLISKGPPTAVVLNVDFFFENPNEQFDSFEVIK